MNEKTNDKLEQSNSIEQQENIGEKLEQEKDQENNVFGEDSSDKNEKSAAADSSEKKETTGDEDDSESS